MGILAVGTIGRNRLHGCVFKADKELAKAGRGSYEVKYDAVTGLTIVKWYDNKAVFLTSSYLGADPVEKCRRWSKQGRKYVEVDRPHIVKVYNKNMGGVDLSDMLMSLYRIAIRPQRWYLRIIYYLIYLSLSNGWLLYRRHLTQMQEKKYMSLLNFRAQVADALINVGKPADLTSRKRGRPSLEDAEEDRAPPPVRRIPAPSTIARLDRFDHFPTNSEKRGRCRRCKNGYTQMTCTKCSVTVLYKGQKLLLRVSHYEMTIYVLLTHVVMLVRGPHSDELIL